MPGTTHTSRITTRSDFRIVDEADDYVVVDKPPLLLVHPTKPNGPRTLWSELRELLAFEIANGGQVSIVNRLDRETSGLVLIAKNSEAARRFHMAMQNGDVSKRYLAVVQGWPTWDETTLDAPLLRQGSIGQSSIWLKQSIDVAGAKARTRFEVVRRFQKLTSAGNEFSLLRATPFTGRTHQIRVHAAALGFPLVGDKIYGADERHYLRFIETGWTEELAAHLLLPRHALHSSELAIGAMSWQSELPGDLRAFCDES